MARFVPPLDPATLTNNGERSVATALAGQLPNSVTVYHGYLLLERFRSRTGREFFREGEIDFVIFDRRRGILVLEVKGGTITYDPEQGYRREETGEFIRSPFEQARDNMHALMDRIRGQPEFSGENLPFVRGYAVVLPHCNWAGRLPADVQPEMLLCYDDMTRLGERIETLLDLWSRRDRIDPLDERSARGIRGALQSALSLIPVMAVRVTDQEEVLRRATDEQARVLEYMRTTPRVAFNGVAGSGKTLLALAQTQTFARQGKRTLLVCYNRPLADWLQGQLPADLRPQAHISTFHSLCQTTCQRAGAPFPVRPNDPDFWLYEAADKLEQAAKQLPAKERFDAVVVDEGQDFPSIWFPALRLLSRPQDDTFPLFWFYDPRQNLFLTDDLSALPPNMVGPIPLSRNCRNTRRISRRCSTIINEEFLPFEGLPEGEEVRELREASLRDVVKAARDQVLQWTERGGRLRPDQIAILTPQEPGDEWPRQIGTTPLGDNFDKWRRGECILLSPHRRFKGLEADALILADVPEPGSKPYFTKADFYVACSRAKHLLTVVSRQGA
jgi:hypothetical protein